MLPSRHAKNARKNHQFICRYTKVDETAPCHGMKIAEKELETMLFQILSKQAESAGQLKDCMDQKRGLYEQFLLQEISMDGYKMQKAVIDKELERLKQVRAALAAQTTQMRRCRWRKCDENETDLDILPCGS